MRYVIFVDGKWQGGSFASEDAAKVVAERLRKHPSQDIKVEPKSSLSKSEKKK